MKISEIVEGFWDSIAKGMGSHEIASGLKSIHQEKIAKKKQAQKQAQQQAIQQANVSVRPHPARKNRTITAEPTDSNQIEVQPGERLDVVTPQGGKYYKTTAGWFSALNQPVNVKTSVDYLERVANSRGKISPNTAPTAIATTLPVGAKKTAPTVTTTQRQRLASLRRMPPKQPQSTVSTTGESTVNEDKICKLINKYITTEMAVRHLRRTENEILRILY